KAVALGLALAIILAIAAAGGGLTLASISGQVETVVTPLSMFWSVMAAWPLVMAFAMISLFLGAISPSRRTAATLATVVVVASYLGNNLAGMISSLERLQGLFLFNYFEASAEALKQGQQPANTVALIVIALAAFGLAVFFFQRRNITVGAWPWQRGKLPA
ncbi:MAG TPA: ABC transporter permease subunit, partial [Anaerolineae bacterium]|nr:ABC transporter permease subunit [Anaerolineae bacterium]